MVSSSPASMSRKASNRTMARPFQLLNLATVDGSHE